MWRLTASRFGDIWKLTSRRNLLRLCKSLECTTSKNKRPLLHGENYESKAIKAFEVKTGLKTKKCGLFVCQEIPCLGASPDAVIDDNEIVEVKCPYSGRDQDIKPGACFKFLKYGDDNKMVLKENHNYYFQIQGQLFISKRKYCHFVVYTFRDLFVKKIEIDKDYCMGIGSKTSVFLWKNIQAIHCTNHIDLVLQSTIELYETVMQSAITIL